MEGKYFSDLNSAAADDAVVFNGKQNRYVYSLEHSFNYNHSDTEITLKVLDVDGNFDNTFFNETFYQRLMNNSVNKYLKDTAEKNSKTKISDFQIYVNDYLQSQIKIYLAYGIGDDLATWTDPIACTLVNADVDVANNGLRSYSYKFIPQINNFFRPEPEKDKNDPNRNTDFEFGAVNARTEYAITTPKLDDLNYNITELLKGFAGKVCNVTNDNVIVVIPNLIPKDITVSALVAGDTANQVSLKTVLTEIKWTDKLNVGKAYLQTFKSIEATYKDSEILKVKQTIPVFKTRNKQDVVIALNKKLEELRKKSSVLQTAEANARQSGAPGDPAFTLDNASEIIETQRRQLFRRKNEVLTDLRKLETTITQGVSQGKTYDQLQKELQMQSDLKKDLKDLQDALGNTDTEVDNLINYRLISSELNSPTFPKESIADGTTDVEVNKVIPASLTLRMFSERDLQSKDDDKSLIPNWRKSINQVFEGMSKINDLSEDAYIVPAVTYETSLRWLKLFKKYNLISDPTQPCLIIGDRQMVLDYIYCNQMSLQFDTPQAISKFKLPDDNKLKKAHAMGYFKDIINLVNRKRNSSSFSEKLYLDELALDPNNLSAISVIENMSKNYDIPIFINNFRNSNVLSYSLKNSENYIAAIKFTVRDNRLKYLASEFNENVYIQLLKDAGMNEPNPIEIAKQLFNKTVKALPEEIKDRKLDIIKSDELSLISNWEKNEDDNNSRNKLNNNKYAIFIKSKIYKSPGGVIPIYARNAPYLVDNKYEKLPLILTQNSENVSYLNLSLQRTLYDTYGSKLDKNELNAMAELIILLNVVNEKNGGNTISFIPGITLPSNNFILARLNEYQHRYAVNLTLKTLPFFNLTDTRTLNKPCIFYSKRISVLNNDSVSFDFFSGEYRIVGFKHVINTQECYSEFMLIKYGASDETLNGHSPNPATNSLNSVP